MVSNTNKHHNSILKNIVLPEKLSNNTLVIQDCKNDICPEPSKKKIGQGSYTGDTAKERIIQGKSKHFNIYTCDKFKSGKCCGCYSESEV